jgi:hypothetical protein
VGFGNFVPGEGRNGHHKQGNDGQDQCSHTQGPSACLGLESSPDICAENGFIKVAQWVGSRAGL